MTWPLVSAIDLVNFILHYSELLKKLNCKIKKMHSTEILVENSVDMWRVLKTGGKSSAHLKLFVDNIVLHNVLYYFFFLTIM